jgi:hypothetical protein
MKLSIKKQGQIHALRYEGLTIRVIAKKLNISKTTVMKCLKQGNQFNFNQTIIHPPREKTYSYYPRNSKIPSFSHEPSMSIESGYYLLDNYAKRLADQQKKESEDSLRAQEEKRRQQEQQDKNELEMKRIKEEGQKRLVEIKKDRLLWRINLAEKEHDRLILENEKQKKEMREYEEKKLKLTSYKHPMGCNIIKQNQEIENTNTIITSTTSDKDSLSVIKDISPGELPTEKTKPVITIKKVEKPANKIETIDEYISRSKADNLKYFALFAVQVGVTIFNIYLDFKNNNFSPIQTIKDNQDKKIWLVSKPIPRNVESLGGSQDIKNRSILESIPKKIKSSERLDYNNIQFPIIPRRKI